MSIIGDPFGQKERLTDRIRDILKRYSGQHCIFKEFIQNADDAGATEIAFIVDSRQLGTNKTFSKEFNKLQGPSLLCWNNAVFTESDLEGITSLGVGSKRDETAKIGRFGVGFNSVYHFTDAPQILSDNSDYVIFDPLCAHIPGLESSNPGFRIKYSSLVFSHAMHGIYADVGSGFQVPRFDLNSSTMFRLSLRQQPSDICSMIHSVNKMNELLESFIQFDDAFLVFLKNVNKVSFYKYSNELELICEKSTTFTNSIEKLNREIFRVHMTSKSVVNPTKTFYSMSIKKEPGDIRKDLLVFEQFGFETKTEGEKVFINRLIEFSKNQEKHFPFGGIAINLAYFTDANFVNNSKLFSFLPLDQSSPLVPHINAYWSLHQENRQKIYEHSMRTENVDKGTAQWCTNWNLSIINYIILPLFIQLLEHLKKNYTSLCLNIQMDQFINRYLCLFPNLRENDLKPYFEQMANSFYQQLYNLELIPVLSRNNNLQWFKPSQLQFTRHFDAFISNYALINYEYRILESIGIQYCRENYLIDFFKKHSEINLPVLKPNDIMNKLKQISSKLVNKNVNETVLKSIPNVKILLYFIYNMSEPSNEAINLLNNVPLVVNQNMIVTTFSSVNKLIINKEPEIFSNQGDRFLHKSLNGIINIQKFHQYFRQISIQDLDALLPSILDPKIYFNNPDYIRFDESRIGEYEKAWEIVSSSLESNDLSQITNARMYLEPIENWSLVPVTTQSSRLFLAPIKYFGVILMPQNCKDNLIFNILNQMNLPLLNVSVIQKNLLIGKVFESAAVSLTKNEDLLRFLDRQHQDCKEILSDNKYRWRIFQELAGCVYKDYLGRKKKTLVLNFRLSNANAMSATEIRKILKSLPIYADVYERVGTLNNASSILYCMDIEQVPTDIRKKIFDKGEHSHLYEDFIDFTNHKNLFIINSSSFPLFFQYLNIPEIKIDRLYEIFFNWVKESNQTSLMKILRDHVFLTQKLPNLYESSSTLLSILKDLAFIKIGGKYYKASDCYDATNVLFKFAYSDKLLTEVFEGKEWRAHLIKLGLNVSITKKDCLVVANKLASSNSLEIGDRVDFCRKLLDFMNKLGDNSLMAQIKDIRFLPSEFEIGRLNDSVVKLLEKIYDPGHKLICLRDSVFDIYMSLVWIQKPVLPSFCRNLIKEEYLKTFEIYTQSSIDLIVTNFISFVDLLTWPREANENLLNNLTSQEVEQLEKILHRYYSVFYQALNDTDKCSNLTTDEINLVLVKRKSNRELIFVEPRLLVKNISEKDQIDDCFYQLPSKFKKHWKLFKRLGAREDINLEKYQEILKEYYTNNRDQPLDDKLYENVLVILKLLFFDDIASRSKPDQNSIQQLYLPNMLRKMRPIISLYYIDNLYYEKLVEQSNEIRDICLLNEKDLVSFVERSLSDDSFNDESNINIMRISDWKNIFEESVYSNGPKPLSEIIKEVLVDMSSLDGKLNTVNTNKINSIEFQESIFELIEILKGSQRGKMSEIIDDKATRMQPIEIYSGLKEIRTCYRDKRTGEVISNSEQEKKFFCLKEDDKIKVCSIEGSEQSDEYYFQLSETILDALQSKSPQFKQLPDYTKIERRFMFVLNKLLKSSSNYKSIISDFKAFINNI